MRDILISIKPEYANKIFDGTKDIELRKKFPEKVKGRRMIIYSSSPEKSILGYVVLVSSKKMKIADIWRLYHHRIGITKTKFYEYFKGHRFGYAIEMKKPCRDIELTTMKELYERYKIKPPQSYRYLTLEQSFKIMFGITP